MGLDLERAARVTTARRGGMGARAGRRGAGTGSGGSRALATLPAASRWAGWEARLATLDANGEIASIADMFGNGNTITSVAGLGAGNRAALVADTDYKGALVAVFTAAAGKRLTRAAWAQGALDEPCTMYIVHEQDDTAVAYTFDAGGGGQTLYMYWAAGIFNTRGNGVAERSVGATRTATARCIQFDGTNQRTYVTDFRAGQEVFSGLGALASTTTGVTLGATQAGGLPFAGRWCAAYYFSAYHDATARAQVGAYINQEFGGTFTVVT